MEKEESLELLNQEQQSGQEAVEQEPLTDEEIRKREYQRHALLEEFAKEFYNATIGQGTQSQSEIFKSLAEQSNYTNIELMEQAKKIKRIYEATETTRSNKEPIYICNNIDDALILENNGKNAILTELNKKVNDKYIKVDYIKTITSDKKAMKRNYILAIRTDDKEEQEEVQKTLKDNKIKFTPLLLIKDTETGEQDTIENYYNYCFINDNMSYFLEHIDPFNNLSNFNYLVYNFENDLREHQEHKKINTGFKKLDFILNGINPGLYVLGARVKYRQNNVCIANSGYTRRTRAQSIIF